MSNLSIDILAMKDVIDLYGEDSVREMMGIVPADEQKKFNKHGMMMLHCIALEDAANLVDDSITPYIVGGGGNVNDVMRVIPLALLRAFCIERAFALIHNIKKHKKRPDPSTMAAIKKAQGSHNLWELYKYIPEETKNEIWHYDYVKRSLLEPILMSNTNIFNVWRYGLGGDETISFNSLASMKYIARQLVHWCQKEIGNRVKTNKR